MNALLVKMSSLGDIVHTLPAVADAARQGVRLDWAVEESYQPLAALAPGVDQVLPVAIRRWRRAPLGSLREIARVHRGLRRRRYDVVIDAQGLVKSAVVARWARARERVGFDAASARERAATLGYARRLAVPRQEHAIVRTRRLFAATFGYDMPASEPAFGLAGAETRDESVLLAFGSSWSSKRWPVASWIAVARHVAAAGMTPVLAPPAPGADAQCARQIAAAVPQSRLCPPTDVAGLVDIVARTRAVVGGDSGIAHLAAALGRPTVVVFGPTSPALTGALGPRVCNLAAAPPCSPCLSKRCRIAAVPRQAPAPCLAGLTPDRVWSSLAELIASEGPLRARLSA